MLTKLRKIMLARNLIGDDIRARRLVLSMSTPASFAVCEFHKVTNDLPQPGSRARRVVRRLAQPGNKRLLDNVVSQSTLDGVVIGGERNHIERNVMNFNGGGGGGADWGLLIFDPANVYRGNTARGNGGNPAACPGAPATTDVCDSSGAGASLGDNFMPFLL